MESTYRIGPLDITVRVMTMWIMYGEDSKLVVFAEKVTEMGYSATDYTVGFHCTEVDSGVEHVIVRQVDGTYLDEQARAVKLQFHKQKAAKDIPQAETLILKELKRIVAKHIARNQLCSDATVKQIDALKRQLVRLIEENEKMNNWISDH
jgi:tRNA uridine 5-carbamoylmethylation protein Kti12